MPDIGKLDTTEVARISLDSIDVGKRFRREFDEAKQSELETSIKIHGLISPIAVVDKRLAPDAPEQASDTSKPYLLLAGERRFRACATLGLEEIDAKVYNEILPPDELRRIELYENIHRENLTWQEEVSIKKEIHELEVARAGKKFSTAKDAPGHSIRDTAALLKQSVGTVSQDLNLAAAIEQMPELADAKTKKDAQKRLDKIKREMMLAELAKRQAAKAADTPEGKLKRQISDSYILQDFFIGVDKVADNTIDFVEIDPPYGVDLQAQKRGDEGGDNNTEHYNEIPREDYPTFMQNTLNEVYRVMKDHSWGILWFGPEPWFEYMYLWLIDAGKPEGMSREDWIRSGRSFQVKRLPIIWAKGGGQTQQPTYNLANSYEMAFYFRKGQPGLVKQGRSNIFNFAPVAAQKKFHPTQRPVALMKEVLETFCHPGARVMVPFAGSGVTIRAASNVGMTAFGFDLTEAYKNEHDNLVHTGKPGAYEL